MRQLLPDPTLWLSRQAGKDILQVSEARWGSSACSTGKARSSAFNASTVSARTEPS